VATDTATVSVGETLYVEVGGEGASNPPEATAGAAGGFNGGGAGGAGSPAGDGAEAGSGGAGGGGASDVRTMPASDGLSPADSRLVVGGGGGGGCIYTSGGDAGSAGGATYNDTHGGGAGPPRPAGRAVTAVGAWRTVGTGPSVPAAPAVAITLPVMKSSGVAVGAAAITAGAAGQS
jgi:hypothetical protein